MDFAKHAPGPFWRALADDIEHHVEDALVAIAEQLRSEAAAYPGQGRVVRLSCSCGVKFEGRVLEDVVEQLCKNWLAVHRGPGHGE